MIEGKKLGAGVEKAKRSKVPGQNPHYSVGGAAITVERAVALPRAPRNVAKFSNAEQEAIVRLARHADAARSDPGENLTGLSDKEFLASLFG